jgi:U3 small nucleolar RNA-associated protein 23
MPLHRYLENTLHGKVKPFITKCTLASILQTTDLHTSQRPEFLPPPIDLPLRHCSHVGIEGGSEEVLPEEECLLDLLSGVVTGNQVPKNRQHFVLATADPLEVKSKKGGQAGKPRRLRTSIGDGIRAYAREIPGVPIVYVKRSVMILEELSSASLGVRRREEKDKFREGLLGMGSRKRKRDRDEDDGSNEDKNDEGEGDAATPKKKKTKKVRGPNPLSVLKKKPKPKVRQPQSPADVQAPAASPKVNGVSAEEGKSKAKRKRKHRKGGKGGTEEDGVRQEVSGLQNDMSDADQG